MPDPDVEIGRGGHPDPEIRGGPGLPNFFFRPFGSQFSLKILGRWVPRASPLDPLLAPYKNLLNAPTNLPGL